MSNTHRLIPKPKIMSNSIDDRVRAELISKGVDEWLADILARRMDSSATIESIYAPSLGKIADPLAIPSLDIAVKRIVQAIIQKEKIIFTCDHDMDGTASAAVLWSAFVDYFKYPKKLLGVVTSHRLTEGYGLTAPVAERILDAKATLVITADKGSSDEEQIKVLKEAKVDVIVTDHHAIPVEGSPKSAYATVNPISEGSTYDPNICGAAVAFLVMAKVRSALLKKGYACEIKSLIGLVDYVAVATIADCVSMRPDRSYTNRAFVKKGLELINQRERPCWEVFMEGMAGPVHSEDIGFQLAPPIAAAGRLDWAEAGFLFLVSTTLDEAKKQWDILISENNTRKKIEKELREKAVSKALSKSGSSIIVFIKDGHSGVHGITASRLVQSFGKPSAVFSPKGMGDKKSDSEVASGSFRGIPGFHVRDCLQYVADNYPNLLIGFGGHAGAAGATVSIKNIPKFEEAFEEGVINQLGDTPLKPTIQVDGNLLGSHLNLQMLDRLRLMEPWGKDFPFPIFRSEFVIESFKPVGDGSHFSFTLSKDGVWLKAIWFNAKGKGQPEISFYEGEKVTFVYKLTDNWFRGCRSAQLIIEAMDCSVG